MTRSYCRLWTHVVFVTKNREALISAGAEREIHKHLFEQLQRYECVPLIINGMSDHVHLLYLSNYKMAPVEIFQKVKGETSHWINSKKILKHRFAWQDGVFSCSISENDVAGVKRYIADQKSHHAKKHFSRNMMSLSQSTILS